MFGLAFKWHLVGTNTTKQQQQNMKEMGIGGISRIRMEVVVVAIIMVCAFARVAKGEQLHKVGNSQGWSPNLNYTLWSTSNHFYLHDWLYFVFDKRYYNVLEVNQTSYENCNEKDFIKNITRGGRDVFQLAELRRYFFIGGGGYCFQGMKLSVQVSGIDVASSTAPAPSPNNSGASLSNFSRWIFISLVVVVVLCFEIL